MPRVLPMDATAQRQGRFIYGDSGPVAQGDAAGLPGRQRLAEEQGWLRWQLRAPDFNVPVRTRVALCSLKPHKTLAG